MTDKPMKNKDIDKAANPESLPLLTVVSRYDNANEVCKALFTLVEEMEIEPFAPVFYMRDIKEDRVREALSVLGFEESTDYAFTQLTNQCYD